MKRGRQRIRLIGILILILAMTLGSHMPVMAASAALSGSCGDGVSYSYSSGVLTIKGEGPMYDYTAATIPWYSKKDKIKTIQIENGVTVLGTYAFTRCRYAEKVIIPASVKSIRTKAFSYCDSLEDVKYAGNDAAWKEINIMSGNSELKTALSTGVATVKTYKEGAGTVAWRITNGVLYVSGRGRTLAYDKVQAIQALMDEKREVNVDVKVYNASELAINLYIRLIVKDGYDFDTVAENVRIAVTNYINDLGIGNDLWLSSVGEVIYHIEGVADYRFLEGYGSDREIPPTRFAKAGTISVRNV